MTDEATTDETTTDEATTTDPPEARSRSRSVALFARDVLIIVLAAILISFLVKTFLFRSFYIPSESMESTLVKNDRIIVNELVPNLVPLERGDVVVFRDPGSWLEQRDDTRNGVEKAVDTVLGVIGLTAPDSNNHLVKRLIGLPGDEVVCCDNGHLTVNGVALDEPYITVEAGEDAAPATFDVTVPADRLWVMGDNRYFSADSLKHYQLGDPGGGMVPVDDVVGRAILLSWPASRWTWLDNYPDVFAGTDN